MKKQIEEMWFAMVSGDELTIIYVKSFAHNVSMFNALTLEPV